MSPVCFTPPSGKIKSCHLINEQQKKTPFVNSTFTLNITAELKVNVLSWHIANYCITHIVGSEISITSASGILTLFLELIFVLFFVYLGYNIVYY